MTPGEVTLLVALILALGYTAWRIGCAMVEAERVTRRHD